MTATTATVVAILVAALGLILVAVLPRLRAGATRPVTVPGHDDVDPEQLIGAAIANSGVHGSCLVLVLANLTSTSDATVIAGRRSTLLLSQLAKEDPTPDEVVAMDEHVVCLVTAATREQVTAESAAMVDRLQHRIRSQEDGLPDGLVLRTGTASFPADGVTPGELVRAAAASLYGITAPSEEPPSRSSAASSTPIRRRPDVIRLPEPMDTLEVAYQPKVSFVDGSLVGAEALVRWPAADGLQVPAQAIVDLARSAGRLRELTDVVMRQAAGHCARMRDAGFTVPISINLTGDDVADPRFPERLDTVLRDHDLSRDSLVLEVTETALLTREVEALGVIPELAEMGTRVSVDDFGTGYSSLSHLRRFPIHEIKIDMSFVDRMVLEPLDAVIVRSIIEMGHGLGMDVVAEGVETADTWAVLAELGTDIAQGHHVMRATDPATFLAWARFRRHRHTPAASSEQPGG